MILPRAKADSKKLNLRVSEYKSNLFDFTASKSRFKEIKSVGKRAKSNLFDFTASESRFKEFKSAGKRAKSKFIWILEQAKADSKNLNVQALAQRY